MHYDFRRCSIRRGDALVFTSTRSGDLELWTADLNGGNLRQLTDEMGYDGGAFFSHDGSKIVFRSTRFSEEERDAELAEYRRLLASWLVRPSRMEIMVMQADGSGRRQLTDLGGANFAPSFFPDDTRVIFASNHHEERARNFDLFAVSVEGESQRDRKRGQRRTQERPAAHAVGGWSVLPSSPPDDIPVISAFSARTNPAGSGNGAPSASIAWS